MLTSSPNNLEQVRRTFEGRLLVFYGDVQPRKSHNAEEVVRVMYPPCGAKPEEVESLQTIMRVIGDCYGISGPGVTRLPIRRCRNS